MKTRKLGANGPEVSAIGFGSMSFGGIFGPTTMDESFACLDAAIEAGITFWDTSNIYGMGVCEDILGAYIAERKPQVTLASKVGIVTTPTRRFDNSADYIRSELEISLKRLNADRIELYYIHRREQERPVEEVVETLVSLIEEGLIGGYGLSEVAPSTLHRAHAVHPCMAVQNEYSLWSRQPELGMIQACAELGTAFVPFSPLGRGMITDAPITHETLLPTDWRLQMPRMQEPNMSANTRIIDGFRAFCRSKGWTTEAAALAWILDQGDHLIPIPATRTAAHLKRWADADQISFTDDEKAEIKRLLPVGFAHGDRYSDDQMFGVERFC